MSMAGVKQGCKAEVGADAVNGTIDTMTNVAVFFLLLAKLLRTNI